MEKLQIINIDGNNYTLKGESGKEYNFALTFYDVEVGIGDEISLHSELLNPKYEEYSTEYFFGPVDQVYGRKVKSADDIDVIAVKIKDKTIVLKRFFG